MAEVASAVASDWLRPWLGRSWRRGRVVGVTPRAVYLAVTDHPPVVVALEGPDAVGLPNGLVVTDDALIGRLRRGELAEFAPDGISGAGWLVRVQRWRRSTPVAGAGDRAILRTRLAGLAGPAAEAPAYVLLPASWPLPDRRLVAGLGDLVAIVTGRVDDPVEVMARLDRLVGYGPGSTPSGDDLVAGFVATLLALAPAETAAGVAAVTSHVREVAFARTTPLSATLLLAAFDGAMARPAAAVISALTKPDGQFDPTSLRRAVRDLGRVGHSSGRDLALGLLGAAHHLATNPPTTTERVRRVQPVGRSAPASDVGRSAEVERVRGVQPVGRSAPAPGPVATDARVSLRS